MPCGLHGAISGFLAGGILGFRTAGLVCVFLYLHRDLAVMFWVSGFLIHRHAATI